MNKLMSDEDFADKMAELTLQAWDEAGLTPEERERRIHAAEQHLIALATEELKCLRAENAKLGMAATALGTKWRETHAENARLRDVLEAAKHYVGTMSPAIPTQRFVELRDAIARAEKGEGKREQPDGSFLCPTCKDPECG